MGADEQYEMIIKKLDAIAERVTALEIKGDRMMALAKGLASKVGLE